MPTRTSFGIAETDDYVRKILGNAGAPPKDASPDATLAWLLPHVIHQESRGNPAAVSPKGAVGVMQTMPATLRDPGFGVTPAKDDSDAERFRVGKDYLSAMIRRYPGRPDLALAAYNAGPGRADKWADVNVGAAAAKAEVGVPLGFRAGAGTEGVVNPASPLGELATGRVDTSGHSLWDFTSYVVGVDSSIAAIHNIAEDMGYKVDPSFRIDSIPKAEWDSLTRDIPEELQPRLGAAVSRAHLQVLADRARAELAAEEHLAEYGGWGIPGRIALNILDPASLAIGYASGGLAFTTKATRLAKAARALTAAGKLEEAGTVVQTLNGIARTSKGAMYARAASLAAAENAALTYGLNQGNITRDGWDVANAALLGAVMGAGFSRIFGARELDNIRAAAGVATERLNMAEAAHAATLRRTEIDTKLKWLATDGDVATAKASLSELQARHKAELSAHTEELKAAALARREALTQQASGALKRSELGELQRTVNGLRKQSKQADSLEAEVLARMTREDVEALGEDVAHSKQRVKMRERAAAQEARARKETIRANLERGEVALGRAQAAQDALTELRKIERRAKSQPGDYLAQLDEPGRNRFGESELALVQRQKAERTAAEAKLSEANAKVAARRAELEAQLNGIQKVTAEAVARSDAQVADLFGRDSGGAARFDGFAEPLHPNAEDSGLPSANPVARIAGSSDLKDKLVQLLTFRKGPFATFSMILRGSPNDTVVNELGRLVGNTIGTEKGAVNTVGASEIAHRLRQSYETRFNQLANPAYLDWCQRNGVGVIERQQRVIREDFMSDVGRAIRGDTAEQDPAVLKVAAGMRGIFADYLREAKAAGVKGFENVEVRDNYLPRVFDFHTLADLNDRIGTGSLRTLFSKAIRAANPELEEKAADTIAKAYVQTMRELRVGGDVGLMQGMHWSDVGFLREFLEKAGIDHTDTEEVVRQFAAAKRPSGAPAANDEGSFRNAKHRVQMDENFEMVFRDQQAAREGRLEDVTVRVSDLFENNVEALFGRYNRTVAGHVALGQVGIKSRADFSQAMRRVENALEGDLDELNRVRDTANAAYALITGTPIEDATSLTRLGRAARDWNFATTMGQSGWAQIPDVAGLLQKGYLGHTMKYFPEIFRTVRRSDGQIDLDFYRELESVTGLGTDLFNNRVFSSFDWGAEGQGFNGVLGKVEHGVRVAGRGVSKVSGLGFMTELSQRLAGRVIVQRLVDDVLKGGALSEQRALQLGLDAGMKARIAKQLKDHTVWAEGDFGGKVQIVNYSAWKDVEARDAMLHAVSKEARRIVQEEDLGDTSLWMHKNWGKTLAQFRRFALVSYSRQILHGIAHADAEEATRVMISMVLAAGAYKARHEASIGVKKLGGMSDEEEQKYREKYLTPGRLAAAAWANSSYSSILPGLWDTGQYWSTGTRMFDTRTSGLSSDLITGNPTYGLLSNANQAAAAIGTSIVRGDRQFDQGDLAALRRLLPFQNVFGMDAPFAALASALPEKDVDPDPESIDFGLNDNPQ